MFISCYWWLLNRWNQIYWTGIVVYGFVEKFEVVLVFWENPMILIKWVELLFLMLDSCLFKCIEAILTHKHFLELFFGGLGFWKLSFGVKKGLNPRGSGLPRWSFAWSEIFSLEANLQRGNPEFWMLFRLKRAPSEMHLCSLELFRLKRDKM